MGSVSHPRELGTQRSRSVPSQLIDKGQSRRDLAARPFFRWSPLAHASDSKASLGHGAWSTSRDTFHAEKTRSWPNLRASPSLTRKLPATVTGSPPGATAAPCWAMISRESKMCPEVCWPHDERQLTIGVRQPRADPSVDDGTGENATALCLAIGPLIRAIVTPRRAVRAFARVGARVLPGSKPRV